MAETLTPPKFLHGETSNPHDDIEAPSASINKPDKHDLFRAASVGDYSIIDKLRKSEDFVNLVSATTLQGNTCLHLAVMGGHQEFVSRVASYAPWLLHCTNLVSETPLILAAGSQNEELGHLIFNRMRPMSNSLELVKKTVLESDANADTAVHHALRNGFRGLAIKLIESHPEVSQKVNYKDESLMYLATWRGYIDVLEKLMLIPGSQQAAPGGATVLRTAILAGNTDIVLKLLEEKCSQAESWDPEDHLALIYAIRWQNPRVVQTILTLWPSLGYSETEDGLSPFSIAAEEDAVSSKKS